MSISKPWLRPWAFSFAMALSGMAVSAQSRPDVEAGKQLFQEMCVECHGADGVGGEWNAVRALDATAGKLRWEFRLLLPGWSSLLSTAGGLVFGGTEEGNFVALDAETGKPLWDTQLGANVRGIPISFATDGKQCLAIGAGLALFVFGLP